MVLFLIVILLGMATAVTAGWHLAPAMPGNHHVWGAIGGVILCGAMLACAADPHYPVLAMLLGVPYLFSAAVSIFKQPDPVGA